MLVTHGVKTSTQLRTLIEETEHTGQSSGGDPHPLETTGFASPDAAAAAGKLKPQIASLEGQTVLAMSVDALRNLMVGRPSRAHWSGS